MKVSSLRVGKISRMRTLRTGMLLLSLTAPHQRLLAQQADSAVTLSFQDADLRLVLSSLAEMGHIPISYANLPVRAITLRSAVPIARGKLRSVLESVAKGNGLTIEDDSGLLRISAQQDASRNQYTPSPTASGSGEADLVLHVYHLQHVRAEEAARTIKDLFGQSGSRTSAAVMPARPALVPPLHRDLVQNPLSTAPPAAADSNAVVAGSPAELRGPIQIVPDLPTNALLIRSSNADYEVLRRAIDQLDTRPLQALIEVVIAEIRNDHQHDLGLDLTVPDQLEPRSGAHVSGEIKDNTTAGDIALRILGVGHIRADVAISALAASSKVRVLSRPIILTQNNQEARILVGSQRPFVQISRALPTDAAVRDQVVQYRDVGTELRLTPTISPDGYMTISLSQEVSNATTETQFGAPIISTREVQTQLFIKNEHTAVIGGLVDRDQEQVDSGIPILKDIPLLGALFRSTHHTTATTELFLLLTPHIVRSDQDMEDIGHEIDAHSKALDSHAKPLVTVPAVPAKTRR